MSGVLKPKKQTIGYRYFLGMHMALCHNIDTLNAIYVDKKELWVGKQVDNGSIKVDKKELFGGDRSEGGIRGELDVLFGKEDQSTNNYLNTQLGEVPSFRGVVSVVLKQMYLGTNPYLKRWSFKASRIKTFDNWYPQKGAISGTAEPNAPAETGGRVAFIIDKSYSMNEVLNGPGGGRRKFRLAIIELVKMLTHLSNLTEQGYNYDVAILFVNDYSAKYIGVTANGRTVPPSGLNNSEIYTYLNFNSTTLSDIRDMLIAKAMVPMKPVDLPSNDLYDPINRPMMITGVDGYKFLDESYYFTLAYDGRYLVYREVESVMRKTDDLEYFFPPNEARNNVVVSLTDNMQVGTNALINPSVFNYDYRGTGSSHLYAKGPFGKMLESGLVRYFGTKTSYVENPLDPLPWNKAKKSIVKYLPLTVNSKNDDYVDTPVSKTYPFQQDSKSQYGNVSSHINNPYVVNTWIDGSTKASDRAFKDFKKLLEWDYPEDAKAGSSYDADMGPAHIIRECLTHPYWGMGYPFHAIDDASFRYAADTFYDEQLGMSLLWDKETTIEEFIREILRHVDAVLYADRRTGNFVLKPIRYDYDENNLIDLNESNILSISDYSKPTLGELANSVTVNCWDKATNTESSVTVQNSALFMLQGAEIATKVQYPGITNKVTAIMLAQRDLRSLSTALIKCTIEATDVAESLNIGDCFTLSWDDYELNKVVMRIVGIAYGSDRKHRVRIQAVQDIFSTPEISLVKPPAADWQDPTGAKPTPVMDAIFFEAPYYELVETLGQVQVDANLSTNPDIGLAMVSAVQPTNASSGVVYYVNPELTLIEDLPEDDIFADKYENALIDVGTVSFCQNATLLANMSYIDTVVLFSINDKDALKVKVNDWAYLGKEIVVIESLVRDSENIWNFTLKRGCLDTQPSLHTVADIIYFVDSYNFAYMSQFSYGEDVTLAISSKNAIGETSVESARRGTVRIKSRAARPYPPQYVKINNIFYNTEQLSTMQVTWGHRNRLQQTGSNILSFFDDTLALPEKNTSYILQLVDNDTENVLYNVSGITQNFHTIPQNSIPFEYANVSIYIISERDGMQCTQPFIQNLFLAEPIGGKMKFKLDDFTTAPSGGSINIKLKRD